MNTIDRFLCRDKLGRIKMFFVFLRQAANIGYSNIKSSKAISILIRHYREEILGIIDLGKTKIEFINEANIRVAERGSSQENLWNEISEREGIQP